MEADLHSVIKARILEEVHKQYILYQILKALKYIHSGSLIHRDLKPSNILLNSDCHVKLCDFGLARSISPESGDTTNQPDSVMTDYVATRWYRAPELLLGSTTYTKGVDVWAVGCILGEALTGKPVFPGKSTLDQLNTVLRLTGRPTMEDLDSIGSPHSDRMLESCLPIKQLSYSEIFPGASVEALDFLRRCFHFNPEKRASISELIEHPYVAKFRDPSKELDAPGIFDIPLDDNVRLTSRDYRDTLYREIAKMKDGAELKTTVSRRPISRAASNPPISSSGVQFEGDVKETKVRAEPASAVPATKGRMISKEHSYRSLTPTTCHTVLNSASKSSIAPVSPAVSSKSTLRTPSSVTQSRLKSPSTSNLSRSPSVKSFAQPSRQTTPIPSKRPSTPLKQSSTVPSKVVSTVSREARIRTITPHRSIAYGLSITSGSSGTQMKHGPVAVKTGTPPGKTTPPRKSTPPVRASNTMGSRPLSGAVNKLSKSSSVAGGFMGLFGRGSSSTSSLLKTRSNHHLKK